MSGKFLLFGVCFVLLSCSGEFSSPPKKLKLEEETISLAQKESSLSDQQVLKSELKEIHLSKKFSISDKDLKQAALKLSVSKDDLENMNLFK